MASLFLREKKSRFIWIKYRDPATGKTHCKSTYCEDNPAGWRKAKDMAEDWRRRERSAPRSNHAERWSAWAEPFLREKYAGKLTLGNALSALKDLTEFFRQFGILSPRMLTYDRAREFFLWRTDGEKIKAVHPNTARLRFVTLSVLMGEAVLRGYAEKNPCRDVKRPRVPPKEKMEITPKDQDTIEGELSDRLPWMREMWDVMMYQGCRVSETRVPMDRIDENAMTIEFKIKGGRRHVAGLSPYLLPLVEKARKEKRRLLVEPPASFRAIWSLFFDEIGMPYTAHCCRVTVISRLIRANFSTAKVANLIGHSEEVQRIYRKLKPEDSTDMLQALGARAIPPPDSR